DPRGCWTSHRCCELPRRVPFRRGAPAQRRRIVEPRPAELVRGGGGVGCGAFAGAVPSPVGAGDEWFGGDPGGGIGDAPRGRGDADDRSRGTARCGGSWLRGWSGGSAGWWAVVGGGADAGRWRCARWTWDRLDDRGRTR